MTNFILIFGSWNFFFWRKSFLCLKQIKPGGCGSFQRELQSGLKLYIHPFWLRTNPKLAFEGFLFVFQGSRQRYWFLSNKSRHPERAQIENQMFVFLGTSVKRQNGCVFEIYAGTFFFIRFYQRNTGKPFHQPDRTQKTRLLLEGSPPYLLLLENLDDYNFFPILTSFI